MTLRRLFLFAGCVLVVLAACSDFAASPAELDELDELDGGEDAGIDNAVTTVEGGGFDAGRDAPVDAPPPDSGPSSPGALQWRVYSTPGLARTDRFALARRPMGGVYAGVSLAPVSGGVAKLGDLALSPGSSVVASDERDRLTLVQSMHAASIDSIAADSADDLYLNGTVTDAGEQALPQADGGALRLPAVATNTSLAFLLKLRSEDHRAQWVSMTGPVSSASIPDGGGASGRAIRALGQDTLAVVEVSDAPYEVISLGGDTSTFPKVDGAERDTFLRLVSPANGRTRFARRVGGDLDQLLNSVALTDLDGGKMLVAGGYTQGPLKGIGIDPDAGNGFPHPAGLNEAVMLAAAVSPAVGPTTMTLTHARVLETIPDTGRSVIYSVAPMPDGIVVCGRVFGATFIDGVKIEGAGQDGFIIRYHLESDGAPSVVWGKTFGGAFDEACESLDTTASGEIVAAINYQSEGVVLDGQTLPTPPASAVNQSAIARFAPDGRLRWVTPIRGTRSTYVGAVVFGALGDVYGAGMAAGDVRIGVDAPFVVGETPAFFLARFSD